jgi:hypothetical protein
LFWKKPNAPVSGNSSINLSHNVVMTGFFLQKMGIGRIMKGGGRAEMFDTYLKFNQDSDRQHRDTRPESAEEDQRGQEPADHVEHQRQQKLQRPEKGGQQQDQ